jgi:hypothetical protein
MVITHLNLIKKALLDNASRQEVANLTQGGGADADLSLQVRGS